MHLRPTTKVQYRSNLDNHILPCLGDRPVGSVTPLDIHGWLAERRANTRMQPHGMAKAYQLLRQVFEAAVDAELIQRNPCRVKGSATVRLPEMRPPPSRRSPSWPTSWIPGFGP